MTTEKTATEKMFNGKLGNRKTRQQKWAGRKKRQQKVITRKERQRYFKLQKKMATGKMTNKIWETDINGEETVKGDDRCAVATLSESSLRQKCTYFQK